MIKVTSTGDFSNLSKYLKRLNEASAIKVLEKYGDIGVAALADATPVDSSVTASSWYYQITRKKSGLSLEFHNSNINKGVPIAIILQYGHGTGTGGWVEGRDYINPAIQPVFEQIADAAWKEITTI